MKATPKKCADAQFWGMGFSKGGVGELNPGEFSSDNMRLLFLSEMLQYPRRFYIPMEENDEEDSHLDQKTYCSHMGRN